LTSQDGLASESGFASQDGFASQNGFALLEVLLSAVIVALIVIATFTGFDVTQRATAGERAHAQADVLAQQDEDRMRGFAIDKLSGFSETRTVTYNGTVYTIVSTGEFLADSTESPSCVKEAGSASYVRTTSKVTWPGLGTRPPVVETGLISPPIGGELLVQIFDGNGNGVAGMIVEATGPKPSEAVVTGTTGANGCVIFASMKEGEYSVVAHQTGYVDKDGNELPLESLRTVSVTTGTTTKKQFQFAKAGALTVHFVTSGGGTVEGDQFLVYNTEMTLPHTRVFGTLNTFSSSVTTPTTLFPFGEPSPPAPEPISPYSVYAGSCPADAPPEPLLKSQSINVTPGNTGSINVVVPPINVEVLSGTSSGSAGSAVTNATGTLKDTGASCATRTIASTPAGKLPHPNMPFGNYSLCVTAKIGVKNRKATIAIANNAAAGTATQIIYLGAGSESSTCP
jgi:Tfp pilus assembly protein PilV